jgi:nitrile hydratase accessory protein
MPREESAVLHAVELVRGIPLGEDGPVFAEPWQAQAFAIAVSLQARGVFSWGEWSTMLGEEIRLAQRRGDPDSGPTYYQHWLATLERIVSERGLTDAATLARYHDAWEKAARRTPHGSPIELKDADFSADS